MEVFTMFLAAAPDRHSCHAPAYTPVIIPVRLRPAIVAISSGPMCATLHPARVSMCTNRCVQRSSHRPIEYSQ
jgi:hypothetical protein